MAISIDWSTQVITVPRTDMTLVQSSPIEIRELNINQFRLALKALEDDEEGIPYLDTHRHNTEVLLGGIVYARVVEIINGYTVTFEDGAYAVNLVGANSNIGDVVNFNQVSVRSSNAAGLISNQAIEFSSFNGGVTVDAINGSSGTIFPVGTPQQPVNNIPDAVLIAELRGFNTIYIKGNYTFTTGDNLDDYNIVGESPLDTTLTFESGANVADVKVFTSTVQGDFDDTANFQNCRILNVNFVRGTFNTCSMIGDVRLAGGSGQTNLIDCKDGLSTETGKPVIDFSGSNNSMIVRNYDGDLNIHNKASAESIEINVSTGGHITLEDTVTAGNIRITGIAEVTDDSTSGATVDISQVIFPDFMQLAAYNGYVYVNPDTGAAGTKFPLGTLQNPVSNMADALTIAEARGFETIKVDGTITLSNIDISGRILIGENNMDAVIVLGPNVTTNKTTFKNMIVAGTLNGYVFVESCALQSLHNIGSATFPTIFRDCIIRGDVDGSTPALQLNNGVGLQNVHFIDCVSGVPGQGTATFDFNSSDAPVAFRKYGGGITVKNITGNQDCTFEFNEGQIVVDSSCTSGKIRLGGFYKLTDNGTLTLENRNGDTITGVNDLLLYANADEVKEADGTLTKYESGTSNVLGDAKTITEDCDAGTASIIKKV